MSDVRDTFFEVPSRIWVNHVDIWLKDGPQIALWYRICDSPGTYAFSKGTMKLLRDMGKDPIAYAKSIADRYVGEDAIMVDY